MADFLDAQFAVGFVVGTTGIQYVVGGHDGDELDQAIQNARQYLQALGHSQPSRRDGRSRGRRPNLASYAESRGRSLSGRFASFASRELGESLHSSRGARGVGGRFGGRGVRAARRGAVAAESRGARYARAAIKVARYIPKI